MKDKRVKMEEDDRQLNHGDVTDKKRRYNVYKPVGEEANILTVETPPGFVDRWVLDYPPGNISKRIRLGYGFVVDDTVEVGDKSIDGTRAPGGVVCKYGDPKHGTLQYLMRIDKDTYDKNQKNKMEKLDEIDKQLGTPKDGFYNKSTVVAGRGFKEPS